MHKKLGPLEAWQWAAILAGLMLVYYEYEKNKANSASTGLPASSTDTSGAIDPTTGLPYADEVGTGAGASGTGGGVGDTSGSNNSGTSLQQELQDLAAIEQLMAGFPNSGALSPAPVGTMTELPGIFPPGTKLPGLLNALKPAKPKTAKPKRPAKPKKTTKSGGIHNPGHHVTTHPHGAKSATSSAPHNARQHTNVAPPSHQRAAHTAVPYAIKPPAPKPKPKPKPKKARH